MAMAMYKIRIIANACYTRYNNGEGKIVAIVNSYNLTIGNHDLVLAEIYSKHLDIASEETA